MNREDAAASAWVRPLRDALRGLRYGSVELVVHDGRIVQIERREKVRFDEAARRLPDHRGRDTTNDPRTDRAVGGSEPAKAEETNE